MAVLAALAALALAAALAPLAALAALALAVRALRALPRPAGPACVAFYHPHTRDGGGGERVLWCAVNAAAAAVGRGCRAVIFTGDDDGAPGDDLASRGERLFGVPARARASFVRVRLRRLSEASAYPFATLLLQLALGALGAAEVVLRAPPRCAAIVDTSGNNPMLIPVARACGLPVAAYVHYPLVSAGMLRRVRGGASAYNNARVFARSAPMRALKSAYYVAIGGAYGACVACASVLMCNSTWTARNLR